MFVFELFVGFIHLVLSSISTTFPHRRVPVRVSFVSFTSDTRTFSTVLNPKQNQVFMVPRSNIFTFILLLLVSFIPTSHSLFTLDFMM